MKIKCSFKKIQLQSVVLSKMSKLIKRPCCQLFSLELLSNEEIVSENMKIIDVVFVLCLSGNMYAELHLQSLC